LKLWSAVAVETLSCALPLERCPDFVLHVAIFLHCLWSVAPKLCIGFDFQAGSGFWIAFGRGLLCFAMRLERHPRIFECIWNGVLFQCSGGATAASSKGAPTLRGAVPAVFQSSGVLVLTNVLKLPGQCFNGVQNAQSVSYMGLNSLWNQARELRNKLGTPRRWRGTLLEQTNNA